MIIKSQGTNISRTVLMQRKQDGKLYPVLGSSVEDGAELHGVVYQTTLDAFLSVAKPVNVLDNDKLQEFIKPKHSTHKPSKALDKLKELNLVE